MKDEVAQGIKNALERGQSLDSAISSFINAGYSAAEVHEAAESLNNSALSLLPLSQSPADSMGSPDVPYSKSPKPSSSPSSSSESSVATPSVSSSPQPAQSVQSTQSLPVLNPEEAKKEGGISKGKIILLSAVLVLLLILLGVSVFFKDAIAGFFGP